MKSIEEPGVESRIPSLTPDKPTAFEEQEIEVAMKQLTRIPSSTVDLDAEAGRKVLKLMEALDEHDDIQTVSSNFNLTEDVMAELSADE